MREHQRTCLRAIAALSASLVIAACAPTPNGPSEAARRRREPPGPVHHVVLVTIDGLIPDAYVHPDAHGLRVPTLRWLVAHGASSDGALSVFPSVTYPSHTSIVTGVVPGKHGIVANRSFDPFENDLEGWRWYAEDIQRDPIWRIAERAGYETALIHWPVSVGADVRWLVPEYWRAKNDNDAKLVRALSTRDVFREVAREHPDFWSRYTPPNVHDDALTDIATHLLATAKPNLVLLHLVEVDGAQHHTGLWTPEALAAIENDDRQLGRILEEIRVSGLAADTNLVVASDHGFMNTGTAVRPGVLLREAGLVVVNDAGQITGWTATVVVSSAQAYVYLHDGAPTATADTVRGIFAAKVRESGSGIGRVYEANEIVAEGGDPKAFLALEAKPGFQFASGCVGEYVSRDAYRATHGYDPNRPEMHASLLLFGPTVAHAAIANARLIDIAPTIAGWLDLSMPGVDGRPLQITKAP